MAEGRYEYFTWEKDCSMNDDSLLLIDSNEDIRWLVGTFIKEKWPVNVIALESIDDGLKH